MSGRARPWFVGAWRRRSIMVPGGRPIEPCEAWWIQAEEAFVDVRVVLPGHERNDLPYSSTRSFAGTFEISSGEPHWHVDLDSAGTVPRLDRGAAGGLFLAADDPLLMIEDAPGRFREQWVQCAPGGDVECVRTSSIVTVRIGDATGVVWSADGSVHGRIWYGERTFGTGPC
jgi:hypothetical protein